MYSCLMWTEDGFVLPGGADVQMNTPIATMVVTAGGLRTHQAGSFNPFKAHWPHSTREGLEKDVHVWAVLSVRP